MFRSALLATLLVLVLGGAAQAKPDIVALYVEAVMTADTAMLDRILAANYLHVSGNGYVQDKEHFMKMLKSRKMIIKRLTVSNVKTTHFGRATLVTGNAMLKGSFEPRLPEGLQRMTMVLERNEKDEERVLLFQDTPVQGWKGSFKGVSVDSSTNPAPLKK
ncbi:MAG: nuclear transport factor 2 family protein [Desulfovibrionaceae bacterium]|nr:nuclear transport factor 2 family protein [Desulfovibrionaceae bacterium]